MYREIWKFNIQPNIEIEIPIGGEILTTQEQYGEIYIWILVDPSAEKEKRTFEVYPTGGPIYHDMGIERKYIGTVQLYSDKLVFHVFELM